MAATAAPAARSAATAARVRIWAQLPSLILLQLVDSSGGTAAARDPNGIDGPQQEESAPDGLSIVARRGALSFTTNSPDAEGYRVFASLAGAPAKAMHDDEDRQRRAARRSLPASRPTTRSRRS